MNASRLAAQLTREEAASVFTSSGELQPQVIADSHEIINGTQLGNKQLVSELTSNGTDIADWGKYTTPNIQKPSGPVPGTLLLQLGDRRSILRPRLQGVCGGISVRVLCIGLGDSRGTDPWLTLNREYLALSILMALRGPAKLRILADDNRTPILVDATMFAANSQPIPRSWVATIREGGVVELGPRAWLEHGFWERYFDGEPDAIAAFRREVEAMTDIPHQ